LSKITIYPTQIFQKHATVNLLVKGAIKNSFPKPVSFSNFSIIRVKQVYKDVEK